MKYSKYVVYFVDTNINEYLTNKDLYEIKKLNIIEISDYQQFQSLAECRVHEDLSMDKSYIRLCQKRFNSGIFLNALYNNEDPVCYIFLVTKHVTITQVNYDLKLPEDTFVFIDLYTYKKYRGQGYHQKLYDAAILKMKENGYKRFWCWLMTHNQISIKAHCKLGIINVTKIIARFNLFGFSKIRIKDVRFSLSDLIIQKKHVDEKDSA